MQIQPYQADIAERMLIGTTGETIHPDAQFVHTENGYWIAWHDQTAALLAPDTPPDIPCFWVEGAQSLEAASGCSGGHHDHQCGCEH